MASQILLALSSDAICPYQTRAQKSLDDLANTIWQALPPRDALVVHHVVPFQHARPGHAQPTEAVLFQRVHSSLNVGTPLAHYPIQAWVYAIGSENDCSHSDRVLFMHIWKVSGDSKKAWRAPE